jgi:heterodisulfide reductase subunit B
MQEEQAQPLELKPITADLAKRIQEELGQNVFLCYQCIKCTSGCPVSEFFDWQPNQIMRATQFGQEDIALESETPWLCATCLVCSTRCPQGLDIAGIMEFLTREATARGIKPRVPEMSNFTKGFMREVNLWGRAYELGLIAELKLRNLDLTSDLDLGLKMILKNKMAFLPSPTRPARNVKPVPGASQAVAYYPGCSLHSTAPEYDASSRAVCEALDLKLIEPEKWICCGSSAAHRIDPEAALRLPMENISLVEQSGFSEVTMPCAMCFNRHKFAQFEIRHDDQKKMDIDEAIGYEYQGSVQVNSLAETILDHVGAEKVGKRVTNPLKGLRAVSYYGCLLTRPPEVTQAKHHENPLEIDELMTALGIEVVDWSYKTSCCGGGLSLSRTDIVHKLSSNLIKHAREAGADVIAVGCPMCHNNLDARQFQMEIGEPMPVFYFSQLMALAFGLPDKAVALSKNLVDPRPLLKSKGFLPSD